MIYHTPIIRSIDELDQAPMFRCDHYLWTCLAQPTTQGQMACLDGQGLVVRMTSFEGNPKRAFQNHRDMVCEDSAVEAFFAFPDPTLKQTTQPSNDDLYFNFELNANGAMYAKTGHGRQGRTFLSDTEYALADIKTTILPDRWTAEFLIPLPLLERHGIRPMQAGDTFFCNFYKISEDPAIQHYAAFCPIPTETPNFHLPAHFARAVVV